MIITKEVMVTIGSRSLKYYRDKNYTCNMGDMISVKVEDLLPNTTVEVLIKCDYCEKEVTTLYNNYHYQYNRFGKFSCCSKCTNEKTKINNLKKYGVEYSNQSDLIKNKTKLNSIKNVKMYDESTLLDVKPDYIKSILTKEVMITINGWNIDHFKQLNYKNLKVNQMYIIPVEHLMLNSSVKVDCKCSLCGNIKNMNFQKYTTNFNRNQFYGCVSCNNISYKITMINKYGVDNCAKLESVIDKKKKTSIKNYSVEYSISSKEVREKIKNVLFEKYGGHQTMDKSIMLKIVENCKITKIKRGLMISDDKLSDWELYCRNVKNITRKNKKILLEKWNGFDFYDGEYIKDNFNLPHIHRLYPTLDHKISTYYGYINNISEEDISDISNLCFTKKYINSMKSKLTIDEFIKKERIKLILSFSFINHIMNHSYLLLLS